MLPQLLQAVCPPCACTPPALHMPESTASQMCAGACKALDAAHCCSNLKAAPVQHKPQAVRATMPALPVLLLAAAASHLHTPLQTPAAAAAGLHARRMLPTACELLLQLNCMRLLLLSFCICTATAFTQQHTSLSVHGSKCSTAVLQHKTLRGRVPGNMKPQSEPADCIDSMNMAVPPLGQMHQWCLQAKRMFNTSS